MTSDNTTDTTDETPHAEDGSQFPDPMREPGTEDATQSEPDTFPRDYVQKLRDENAKYRQRAGRVDELAQRLHISLVAATGRLADPTDLPFDAEHLDSEEALSAAIDELLTRKAHLASRRPVGEIGQGVSASADTVNLAGLLRSNAL